MAKQAETRAEDQPIIAPRDMTVGEPDTRAEEQAPDMSRLDETDKPIYTVNGIRVNPNGEPV